MRRVAGVTLIASVGLGTLAAGALVRRRVEGGETGISRPTTVRPWLVAQGVKPSGSLGWLVGWAMPLLFGPLYREMARLLELRPDDDVLDVACGSGVFLRKYAAKAHRIAGLDHSEVQVRLARRQNRERIRAGTAEIAQGNSAALPWADETFSAVTCNCLGCFAEPLRSLQEMRRVLRPGGRVVLSIDAQKDAETARRSEQQWGLPAWTEDELLSLMAQAGFGQVCLSRDGAAVFARAVKATSTFQGETLTNRQPGA